MRVRKDAFMKIATAIVGDKNTRLQQPIYWHLDKMTTFCYLQTFPKSSGYKVCELILPTVLLTTAKQLQRQANNQMPVNYETLQFSPHSLMPINRADSGNLS